MNAVDTGVVDDMRGTSAEREHVGVVPGSAVEPVGSVGADNVFRLKGQIPEIIPPHEHVIAIVAIQRVRA